MRNTLLFCILCSQRHRGLNRHSQAAVKWHAAGLPAPNCLGPPCLGVFAESLQALLMKHTVFVFSMLILHPTFSLSGCAKPSQTKNAVVLLLLLCSLYHIGSGY